MAVARDDPDRESLLEVAVGIVDDDPRILRALRRLLRSSGFSVETFESAEALLASESLPLLRCLVVDIHLRGMNGFDLQERLVEARLPIPTIFITALDDASIRERAQRPGAVDYLHKPFDEPTLLGAIRRALNAA